MWGFPKIFQLGLGIHFLKGVLIGMDRNQWEIILEHLLAMGLIAKQEIVSDDDG
jgi:hypothetical protein